MVGKGRARKQTKNGRHFISRKSPVAGQEERAHEAGDGSLTCREASCHALDERAALCAAGSSNTSVMNAMRLRVSGSSYVGSPMLRVSGSASIRWLRLVALCMLLVGLITRTSIAACVHRNFGHSRASERAVICMSRYRCEVVKCQARSLKHFGYKKCK